MPHFEYDKDYPYAAFITNLGKYNDDYGMIDGVINNGRRGEGLEKAKNHRKGRAEEKALHTGAAGGCKAGMFGAETPGGGTPRT